MTDAAQHFQQVLGSKWETVYKKADDFYHRANREISTIATEAMIFKSNVRATGTAAAQKAMDFFHYDATRQQLHSLHGYVSKVNDTVQKEVPLRMTMAAEYLKCQASDKLFTVENNAYMAFAKIHSESKQALKNAMHDAGNEIGGMVNPEIASDLLSFYHDVKSLQKDVQETIDENLDEIKKSKGWTRKRV